MKQFFLLPVFFFVFLLGNAQKKITDKHITYQQERMVFKQWDASRFTPKPGFLGLNPEYWITWALHPNYPDNDLRPLGPVGPQTFRLAYAASMQSIDNAYKLHADTLRNTAVTEMANYSPFLSDVDPLWQLYYNREFDGLLSRSDPLAGVSARERDYLVSSGLLAWFWEESSALAERLDIARTTTVDRGSRIMAYHRMLSEYRKLLSTWESKKARAKVYLSAKASAEKIRAGSAIVPSGGKSDIQIANDILKKSKL